MKFWQNPKIVNKTPIITSMLIDGAAIGQIARMWREQSALGQSLVSWCSVIVALILWDNFYRVITPDQKWALITIKISIVLNVLIVASIIWFRYVIR